MNRSIIFTLTVVFILSFSSVIFAFTLFNKLDKEKYYKSIKIKYGEVFHTIRENVILSLNFKEFNKFLKPLGVEYIKDKNTILKNAKVLKMNINNRPKPPHHKNNNMDKFGSKLLQYDSTLYIYENSPFKDILLKELNFKPYNNNLAISFLIFIELIFILSYIFTIKKLLPLKKLKRDVEKFGNGDFSISFKIDSKDEIADVANALEISTKKINRLINSRQLFLRNIMHELKTPITKGKVAIALLEDSKNQKRLINIFHRMEVLVKESVMIEEITSGQNRLRLQNSRVIDLIDEAIDIAMIDKNLVKINFKENIILSVDFNFFAIAIKNLIDNAIKYSNNKRVEIKYDNKNKNLMFINQGEELKENFSKYIEPFFKGNLNEINQKGFGLGLYIVSEIIKLHKFKFHYFYKDNSNYFVIKVN